MAARARKKAGGDGGKKIAIIAVLVILVAVAAYAVLGGGGGGGKLSGIMAPKNFINENGDIFTAEFPVGEWPELPYTDPATGWRGWPAFVCNNSRCPGRRGGEKYIFPLKLGPDESIETAAAPCPECVEAGFDREETLQTSPYVTDEQETVIRRRLQENGLAR
jgi:hypothetical protein